MKKINIIALLKEGWDFLIKHPVIVAPMAMCSAVVVWILPVYAWIYLIAGGVVNILIFFLITQYVYEAKRGNPSWNAALRSLLPRLPILLAVTVVFVAVIFGGMCLLLVPGIFLLVRWCAYDYAIMFDNEGFTGSFKKSWRLTQGNFWRIFLVMNILYAPYYIAEVLPKTDQLALVKFALILLSQAWWTPTMVFVYLQLKEIKGDVSKGPRESV